MSTELNVPVFNCEDISVTLSGHPVLKPLSLSLSHGQVYGLIGHNGSGKSTLLKILARQLSPQTGQVSLEGKSLSDWSAREFAQHVAYLPQDTAAAPGLTVAELVAHGRFPWHGSFGRFSEEDQRKTEEAMDLTGVSQLRDRLVDTLSGGERQRVWIAMLVAQDAKCLLLDEPISALDISHQLDVLGLIHDLCHRHGMTVILVLHDINMAARYCDYLLALKQGALVREGVPSALLTAETLAEIYGVPMDVVPHPKGQGVLAYVD